MLPKTFPVTCHTDFVGKGSTFVAIEGQNENGLLYVPKALQKGATTIVIKQGVEISKELRQKIKQAGAVLKRVKNDRVALATLSAQAADNPAKKLKIFAITGTKGKTTTAHVLYHLLVSSGFKTALIGTIENKISTMRKPFKTNLTTPQPDYLHQFFKLCVKKKVEYVVMETAAQAVTFCKLETLEFEGAIFTNLDREHGELYPTMEEYFQTKAAILKRAKKPLTQLINIDDVYGQRLWEENKNKGYLSFGQKESVYTILIPPGSFFPLFILNGLLFEYSGHFPGEYNIYNIAAAVAICLEQKIDFGTIQKGLHSLTSLPGRYEPHELPNGAWAIIDYAHTPASFEALFKTVKKEWTKQLIVIFGAGGGKDHEKRPLMGAIAAKYADLILLTSDNPGYENPQKIAKQIEAGIEKEDRYKVFIELDREQAIRNAYAASYRDSTILLLGKGPDEYQKIKGQVIPFQERVILQSLN
jgi:UDP-N-acetylmuramoyl-L-alanyl-D-glutamate--2,6-diaminopimelate ligase